MTDKQIAVKVDHVSKYFKLPTEATNSLRTAMVNRFKGIKGYKEQKVLKDISKMTDDTFLLNKIIDFAVAQNEEVKGKFLKINELINSEEENEKKEKKIYELMGYDFKEMMKLKEEEELAELEELEEEEIEDENSEKEENSETVEIETTDSKEEDKKENKNHFEEFTEETGY